MNRAERAQFAAEIEARVLTRVRREVWRPGTVIDAPTTSDAQVGVALDSAEEPTGLSDEAGVTQQTVEFGQTLGDPPAVDERVMCRYRPGGGLDVLGTIGGAWRLLGGTWVAGGTANQNSTAANNVETDIALLTVEVDVPRPNRWVTVSMNARLGADVASGSTSSTAIRCYREDYTPAGVASSTYIGVMFADFLRSDQDADGEVISASVVDVAPEPGVHRYYLTCQTVAGFTVSYNLTTDPTVAAWLDVVDRGPLPEDVTIP